MNTTNTPTGAAYRSLDEIRDQKDRLLDEIRRDDQQIKTLWGSLFAKPEPNFALTPSKRIGSLVSNGAAIFDGILLGWKLYRKFRRKR